MRELDAVEHRSQRCILVFVRAALRSWLVAAATARPSGRCVASTDWEIRSGRATRGSSARRTRLSPTSERLTSRCSWPYSDAAMSPCSSTPLGGWASVLPEEGVERHAACGLSCGRTRTPSGSSCLRIAEATWLPLPVPCRRPRSMSRCRPEEGLRVLHCAHIVGDAKRVIAVAVALGRRGQQRSPAAPGRPPSPQHSPCSRTGACRRARRPGSR